MERGSTCSQSRGCTVLELYFEVDGSPTPQGSKSAYVRGGRAVLVEANKKLPAWRLAVKSAAELALAERGLIKPFTGPVRVTVTFFLAKPAKPKWPIFPASKPDLDKLARAVLDGCLPLWTDDSLVVDLVAAKRWVGPDSRPNAGCSVHIEAL